MTRRNPPAQWVLPDVIDPPKRRCFIIEVPDEPQHVAAFRGAILNLASGYQWADDPTHKAREVALVWRDVYDKIVDCPPPPKPEIGGTILEDDMSQTIRISPDDGCIIQMWCIDHWEDWYDPRSCIAGGVTQPDDGGAIGPGECRVFQVALQANGKWRLPVPVKNGYIITVSGLRGAWTDGGGDWRCAGGENFILGICGGAGTRVLDGSDPVTAAYHMQLVGIYDGSTGIPVGNGPFTVTGQASLIDLDFQANDAALDNNYGSVYFQVQVCNGAATCVDLAYLLGATGPTSVCIGEEFDFVVNDFDGVAWNGGITFSPCCSLTLVSQSGAIVTTADHEDCAHGYHTGFSLTNITKLGTNSSIGAFTLHLRLDSIT